METAFRRFGTMIDCSRNAVMNTSAVKRWIDVTAGMGYNTLMLYTEDTYEVNNQPYFGYMRGRYSQAELRELDDYAAQKGMELIPCIQTLAHLNAIFRWPVYGDIRDCDDILLAGDDKTYRLLEDIFQTLENTFRSRTINIGMDEAHMLGRGKYQDLHGFEDRSELLVKHLARVAEIAAAHGFELIMWGDMFFRLISGGAYYVDHLTVSDEVKKKIPANVNLIYWDYYSTDQQRYDKQIKAHSAIKENIWFAGGLWIWSGFAPHNRYSITATSAALTACRENGVQDVFLTMWGDDGAECAKFSVLPSLYFAAEAARGNTDMQRIKDGFRAMFGIDFDTFMLLDLPGTPALPACWTPSSPRTPPRNSPPAANSLRPWTKTRNTAISLKRCRSSARCSRSRRTSGSARAAPTGKRTPPRSARLSANTNRCRRWSTTSITRSAGSG